MSNVIFFMAIVDLLQAHTSSKHSQLFDDKPNEGQKEDYLRWSEFSSRGIRTEFF